MIVCLERYTLEASFLAFVIQSINFVSQFSGICGLMGLLYIHNEYIGYWKIWFGGYAKFNLLPDHSLRTHYTYSCSIAVLVLFF